MKRPAMQFLRLQGYPILQQLQLEERLLRTTSLNWCLINEGTSPPAIVMGISGYGQSLARQSLCCKPLSAQQQTYVGFTLLFTGMEIHDHDQQNKRLGSWCRKPQELLDVNSVIRDGVPVIRRFSGGGTVIVDDSTVFVTLICRSDAVPVPKLYPRPIMDWTEQLYLPAFRSVPGFHLREHGEL